MKIADSTFIVTGGASGLGEATVRLLHSKQANVVIFDINDERGLALQKELGERALFIKVDVTSEENVKNGIKMTVEKFGGIQGVINCAGVGYARKVLSRGGVFPLEIFIKVIQINLVGTFNVIRLVAQQMATQSATEIGERGVIINTASVAAFEGQQGQVAYSASKGGVVAMTLPLAREFAHLGIRVMTIAPGVFATPLFQALPQHTRDEILRTIPFPRRFGMPEEFGNLCVSIIENVMLNGEVIRLDGALRLAML
jgi:3-hydroxyacyl-CoA dehydrogenase/3-hydroxy-2-methylbutyryl-CoA dehydrogenase